MSIREDGLQMMTLQDADLWEVLPVDKPASDHDDDTDSPAERSSRPEPKAGETPDEVVVTAAKQLTLRCGKASITLTKSGKIILRGKYILSRSEGVNRIKGGSVQIN